MQISKHVKDSGVKMLGKALCQLCIEEVPLYYEADKPCTVEELS